MGANWVFRAYQRKYCTDWDRWFNEMMDDLSYIEPDRLDTTATLHFKSGAHSIVVWTANNFYACAHIYVPRSNTSFERRAKALTMCRFYSLYRRVKRKGAKEVRNYVKNT